MSLAAAWLAADMLHILVAFLLPRRHVSPAFLVATFPRAPRRHALVLRVASVQGVPGLAATPWPVPLLASAVHKWVPGLAAIPKARALAGQCLFRAVPAAVVGAFSRARPCRHSSSPRFLALLVGHIPALLVATSSRLLSAFRRQSMGEATN